MHTYEIEDYSSQEYESRLKNLYESIAPSSWMDKTRLEIKDWVSELVEKRNKKADYLAQYKKKLEKTSEDDAEYQIKLDEAASLCLMFYNDETFHSLDFRVIKDFARFLGEFEKNPAYFLLELMELKGFAKTYPNSSVLSEHRILSRRVNNLWLEIYNCVKGCSYSLDELLLIDDFASGESVKQNYLNTLRKLRIKMGVAEYLEPEEDTEEQIQEMIAALKEINKELLSMMDEIAKEGESEWNDEEWALLDFPDDEYEEDLN